jgi:hypothetical protein
MKPEKITKFESSSNVLKVGKRNSFMSDTVKAATHRTSSFRLKPYTNVVHSILPNKFNETDKTQDIQPHPHSKHSTEMVGEIMLPKEKHTTSQFKQRLSVPATGVEAYTIEQDDSTEQKIEIKVECVDDKLPNPIQSYCAPDPFVNCDQSDLDKMVANLKMPEFKKSKFRKMYREHVIQTLQSICLIKSLKCPSDEEISPKILNLKMPVGSILVNRNKDSCI